MSYVPKQFRQPRSAGKAHYYLNPRTLDLYANGETRVRLTYKQLRQAISLMDGYAKNRGGVK